MKNEDSPPPFHSALLSMNLPSEEALLSYESNWAQYLPPDSTASCDHQLLTQPRQALGSDAPTDRESCSGVPIR